jgi:hypothetical protein
MMSEFVIGAKVAIERFARRMAKLATARLVGIRKHA